MRRGLLTLTVFLFLGTAAQPDSHDSHGSYAMHVAGFGQHKVDGEIVDQGHFDQVGRLKGCTNPGPGELYRGGAPDFSNGNAFKTLEAAHIGFVVDLRIEGKKNKAAEEAALIERGIGYVNIPMTTEEPMPENVTVHIHVPAHGRTAAQQRDVTIPMRDSLNMASQFIQDRLHEKANVFVHCAHGEDRTGTVVGRIRDCAAWKGEFDRYGGTFYKPLKKLFTSSQAPSLDFNRALVQLDPHPCGGN